MNADQSPEEFAANFYRESLARIPTATNAPAPLEPLRRERSVTYDTHLGRPDLLETPTAPPCVPDTIHVFETTLPSDADCVANGCGVATTPGITNLSAFFDTPGIAQIIPPLIDSMWWRIITDLHFRIVYASGEVSADGQLLTAGATIIHGYAGEFDPVSKEFKERYCYSEEMHIEVGCGGETADDAIWPEFVDEIDDNNSTASCGGDQPDD